MVANTDFIIRQHPRPCAAVTLCHEGHNCNTAHLLTKHSRALGKLPWPPLTLMYAFHLSPPLFCVTTLRRRSFSPVSAPIKPRVRLQGRRSAGPQRVFADTDKQVSSITAVDLLGTNLSRSTRYQPWPVFLPRQYTPRCYHSYRMHSQGGCRTCPQADL